MRSIVLGATSHFAGATTRTHTHKRYHRTFCPVTHRCVALRSCVSFLCVCCVGESYSHALSRWCCCAPTCTRSRRRCCCAVYRAYITQHIRANATIQQQHTTPSRGCAKCLHNPSPHRRRRHAATRARTRTDRRRRLGEEKHEPINRAQHRKNMLLVLWFN